MTPARTGGDRRTDAADGTPVPRAPERPVPLGPRSPPLAGSPRAGSGFEAVCEVEQVRRTRHPSAGSRQGDVRTPGPAGGNRVQPAVRAGEAAGDRGDGVRATAGAGRGAYRVLVTGRRARGPDGGARARPDGSVECGGPVGVPAGAPARGEDDGVSLTVVRADAARCPLPGRRQPYGTVREAPEAVCGRGRRSRACGGEGCGARPPGTQAGAPPRGGRNVLIRCYFSHVERADS